MIFLRKLIHSTKLVDIYRQVNRQKNCAGWPAQFLNLNPTILMRETTLKSLETEKVQHFSHSEVFASVIPKGKGRNQPHRST